MCSSLSWERIEKAGDTQVGGLDKNHWQEQNILHDVMSICVDVDLERERGGGEKGEVDKVKVWNLTS